MAHWPRFIQWFLDTRRRKALRRVSWVSLSILALVVMGRLLDEPLRSRMERGMNQSLTGYLVEIPKLHLSPFSGSIALMDLTVRQRANPEPPVLVVPSLRARVQWRSLLAGRLVADFQLDAPRIHVNLVQLRQERQDPVALQERGWQEAVQQIYPLKINHVRVVGGRLEYIDEDPRHPLLITHLNLDAQNIRNIRSGRHVYPSPIHADGVIFESGHGVIDGNADFLATPFTGVQAQVRLVGVPLELLRSVAARANLSIRGGTLDADGLVEFAPKIKRLQISYLDIRDVQVDYIHAAATARAESARSALVARAAKAASERTDLDLRLQRFSIEHSTLGMVNQVNDPPYRVYLSEAKLRLANLSNRSDQGPATGNVAGMFMGSGKTTAEVTFRTVPAGPEFSLVLAIEGARMTAMNGMLLASGGFDVVGGIFDLYAELQLHGGQINGYLKPVFKNVKVYDRAQDRGKSFSRRSHERLLDALAKILRNRQGQVVTRATIHGPATAPAASTLQVVFQLIRNAYFRTILPGLDHQPKAARKASRWKSTTSPPE